MIGISSLAIADLSWEYVEQRESQMEELLEQRPAIEAIAENGRAEQQDKEPPPAEKQAYEELGYALARHSEMAAFNQAESSAIKAHQQAVKGGNPLEISLALQRLTKTKAARYQKAASIPELKQAIDKWQQAAHGIDPSKSDLPDIKSGLEAIQAKLKALAQAMGR